MRLILFPLYAFLTANMEKVKWNKKVTVGHLKMRELRKERREMNYNITWNLQTVCTENSF